MRRKPFGRYLAQACKEQGVTTTELARRLGVTQPRATQILGSPSITEEVFRRAAATLGLDVHVELVPKRRKAG